MKLASVLLVKCESSCAGTALMGLLAFILHLDLSWLTEHREGVTQENNQSVIIASIQQRHARIPRLCY